MGLQLSFRDLKNYKENDISKRSELIEKLADDDIVYTHHYDDDKKFEWFILPSWQDK